MDRKRMIKILESALLLVLAVGITACSSNDGFGNDGMMGNVSNSMECCFRGVWTVDDVKADTTEIKVITDYPKRNLNTVEYWGFPYKTMASIIVPDVNIAEITSFSDAGPISPDQTQLFQMVLDGHGGNINSIMTENYSSIYRCVGMSEGNLYLELRQPETSIFGLYLPFIVTTNQGEQFAVVATIDHSQSTAILNIFGDNFTNILTVSQIEIIKVGKIETKTLSPEMKLKFTSIQRTDRATVGN